MSLIPALIVYLSGLAIMTLLVATATPARRALAVVWAILWFLPVAFYVVALIVAAVRGMAEWLGLTESEPAPESWGSPFAGLAPNGTYDANDARSIGLGLDLESEDDF